MALLANEIGPGDEVITTPFTFIASGNTVSRAGASPVFVDIDPWTFNINPVFVERAITERTKAILPVHLFGQLADMDALMEVAARYDLPLIEDNAQAIGATHNGQPACSGSNQKGSTPGAGRKDERQAQEDEKRQKADDKDDSCHDSTPVITEPPPCDALSGTGC